MMIVYHNNGRVIGWHDAARDPGVHAYPGATRRAVPVGTALDEDADGTFWLPEAYRGASPSDVYAEAARRKRALVGAPDDTALDRAILDGTREAVRLLRIGEDAWTDEQAARAAQLEQFEAAITAIDAAATTLTAGTIPPDFADDRHWPPAG